MIQRFLKNYLEKQIPEFAWTVDYRTADDHTAVVYDIGGDPKSLNDLESESRRYQVELQSTNFDLATFQAQHVYDLLHNLNGIETTITTYKQQPIYIQYIHAITPPLRLGVKHEKMIYTINFKALILPQC